MLKPIGVVNRINYLLKNPHLKGMSLRHVKLNAKQVESAQNFGVNYEIHKDYQMFARQVSLRRGATSTTVWSYSIDKKGLVKDLMFESKDISSRYGTVLYRSNGDVIVKNNRNTFNEKTHMKNLSDGVDLSSLPPPEQVRIRNIKRYIKLIKLNPAYEKYEEAFSKIILGK